MKSFKFKHGISVKDAVTGFSGVITGRADYITGCNQYLVSAKSKGSGIGVLEWYDEDRIVLLKAKPIVIKIGKKNGGPVSFPAPKK